MNTNKIRRMAWILSFLALVALAVVLCVLPAGAEIACNCGVPYENGFCTKPDCDMAEIAPLNEGVYEISNAGQLYYVAGLMQDPGRTTALAAKLMCNITVNAALLDANGVPRTNVREWITPGHTDVVFDVALDGQGYHISGLYADHYVDNEDRDVGLFGNASNVVISNLGIEDSYFRSYMGNAGGLIASAQDSCVITNCYVQNVITEGTHCGALVGALESGSDSTVKNCYTTASICVGWFGANNQIINCYYLDTAETDTLAGTTYFNAELLVGGTQDTLVKALSGKKDSDGEDDDESEDESVTWVISCHNALPALRVHHVYEKACSRACTVCADKSRPDAADHSYADCVSVNCSVCNEARTGALSHVLTAPCATECIECGATITNPGSHTYSYDCDASCICGYVRNDAAHLYAADCAARCAYCNAVRDDVAPHAYDNDCDQLCNNGCGTVRTAPHAFESACDDECNACGQKRQVAHAYGEYVLTKEPTALKNGTQERTCALCGHKDVQIIARLGVATWVIVVGGVVVGTALSIGGFLLYWCVIKKRTVAQFFGKSPEQLKAKEKKKRAAQRRLEKEEKKKLEAESAKSNEPTNE